MLSQAGYSTVVLDNLSRGDRRAVVRGVFVEGDMGDPATLHTLFSQSHFDAVLHFGAFIDVGESMVQPEIYYENNVVKTETLLQAMVQHQVSHLVFSSTAAVYGLPQKEKISETHPKSPINPYGASKLQVEQILARTKEIRSISLRYFNAAGGDPEGEIKNRRAKESNLIPLALRSLLNGTTIEIFGIDYPTPDGTCIRDYVHVADLGTAHLAALELLLRGGESRCYNLGNGEGFSVRQVLQAVERVTGRKLKVREGSRRPGDSPKLIADATLAKEELGWHPRYKDLETIVGHAWQAIKD